MQKSEAAAYLAGVKQVEGAQASAPTNLHVITGEVGQKSEDGKTTVSVDGLVFSEEDSQEIEMDTLGGLEEGDIATIILTGEAGHAMTPLAIGAVGSVDRIDAKVIETQLLLADKADIQDLTAATARIDDLEADHVTVNDFTAATGRIGDLEADHVTVNDFTAATGRISDLEADHIGAADIEAEQARVSTLLAGKANVSDLNAATGRIDDLEADHVSVDDFEAATGRIGDLEADHIGTADLQAEQARVDNLLANKASVSDLNAATGRIGDLEADHVTVADFQAEQANIDTLQANTADIATIRANSAKVQNLTAAQLEADHATIGSLSTTYATIANLNAANGRITNLESTKANISDLEANYITADVIEATYMHANMSNSDVAWIENGTIKNGAIVSAMINDVSANKLTAGTINGSVINVTNLNADNITTGTINGQRIGTGSLSLDKLADDVYTEAEVNNIVDGLNNRIDGAIETHTGTAVPTLNNSPASSWNTTKLKDEHVGDVYYVVNSQSQQNGYCYRFTKSGSTYSWQLIKDSDVTAALSRLTTAEGKITTFDSDISTLKTDTGTLTTRTTNLETRMSDAEDDILDKVDTTTFNEVSDTVDAHTQTISQHTTALSNKADNSTVTAVTNRVSTVEQDVDGIETSIGELQTTVSNKADSSTVTTVSNRLNTVSDTVDGHTQTLTSVQNTLSTKADSSTVSTLSTQVNTIEDTVDGHTSQLSSITSTQTTMQSTLDKTVKSSIQLWYSKANTTAPSKPTSKVTSTSTSGNAWRIVVPAYNASYPHYYYCWQYEYVDGTYGWSAVVRDIAMGESQSTARTADSNASAAVTTANTASTNASTALTTANTANTNASEAKTAATTASTTASEAKTTAETAASDASTAKTNAASAVSTANSANTTATNAQSTANANIKSSVQLWFTKANSTAPNKPTSVISTSNANTANAWNLVVPVWNSSYPHYFYCYQQQKGDGTYQWTDVVYDRATSEAQQLANTTSTNLSTLQTDYATFKQTTEQFESTVGTTYATKTELNDATDDITALEGRVSTNETSISNNASAIALKANSSDVYTKSGVDGLISTEVTNRNAAITAKANEITSSVSQTYTTKEEFENLELGGRNLLKFTAKPEHKSNSWNRDPAIIEGWSRWSVYITVTNTDSGIKGELAANSHYNTGFVVPLVAENAVIGGVEYTLSFDYRTNLSSFGSVYLLCARGVNPNVAAISITPSETDWQHYEQTLKWASTNGEVTRGLLIPYSKGPDKWVEIRNQSMKLERGNKATDWTPAPEDVDAAIDKVDSKTSVRLHLRRDNWTDAQWATYASVGHAGTFANVHISSSGETSATGFDGTALNVGDLIVIEGVSTGTGIPYSATAKVTSVPTSATGNIPATVISANNAKAIETRVTSAESNISQNAQNIELKVSKDGVISTINQSAELVKIQASKVDITGDVVFSAINNDTGTTKISGGKIDATSIIIGPSQVTGLTTALDGKADTTDIPTNVSDLTNDSGFQTSSQVESAITGKGYQTSSQVESAITSKGYATTTQAQGYANTAKTEAISAAATDATTKANAVQTNLDNLEIGGRNLLRYVVYNYASSDTNILVKSRYRGMYCAVDGGETYTISRRTVEGNRFRIYWSEQEPASGVETHALSMDDTALKVTVDVPSEANWLFIYLSNQGDVINDGNIKVERGNKATDWTPAPEDLLAEEQYIYISSASGTTSINKNTTWVTQSSDVQNAWTTKRPTYNSSYPVLFVAKQSKNVGGSVSCTIPVKDDTTTVIDGGHITTGTIDTNRLNAATIKSNIVQTTDLSASKITSGDISADRIKTNVISAINSLTAGQINAARINASQLTIGQSQVTNLASDLAAKADTSDIPTNVSDLTNDSGFQTSSQVESAITSKGYATTTQAQGYATTAENNAKAAIPSDISELNNDSGYITSADVPTKVSDLTNDANYATTTQAQGYATTAKTEAISAAATDATTKANAVQDNLNATRAWYAECPTAAGNAAKVATITPATTDFALAEGVTVAVKFTYANGVASPTLNVNNTGGKSIKRYGTTAPSTSAESSWNAGNVVTLVYDGTYWQMTNWLNNNDNYYDRENYKVALAASTEIAAGRVAAMGSDNKLKILAANSAFDISGPILYVGTAYSAANVTDGATRATNYTFWGTPFALTNTHAITGAAAGKPVYIVGTLSGNMFTPNSDVFTCTTPTSTDNLVYMRLGIMSTTANAVLESQHPLYMYFNGAFQQCDKSTADAAKTATNYIVADSSGIKIADANPSTATTYLHLASTFLDFIRGGVSMLKAWVDGSVAKVRVGAESGFNTLTDDEGIKLRSGTTVLGQFAANLIELGKNSSDSVISLCGGKTKIEYDGRTMFSMTGTSGAKAMHYMLIGSDGTQSEDAFSAISAEGHDVTNRAVISVDATYDDSQTSVAGIYAERLNLSYWGGASIATDVYFPMSSVVNAIPVTLYDNDSASASAATTLSETAANFKRLTIFFKDTDSNYSSVDVWSPNGKRVALSLTWINGASTQEMYQRVRWVTISGTSISTYKASGDSKYRTGQIKLGATASVTNSDYIAITHVIGYR